MEPKLITIYCAFVLILMSFFGIASIAQEKKFACPMENGVILLRDINKETAFRISNPSPGNDVTGTSEKVLSPTAGIVTKAFSISDRFYIIIKAEDDFIICGDMDSCSVKDADTIKKGDLIGVASSKKILLLLSDKKSVFRNPEKNFNCKCVLPKEN